ncbi:non-ribosomal peptide synthetase [Nonomuraea soli]|uniref:Amino acid adenylation domain-containing protein n=1 Tax=Nonomuraea soli TaxID=1032476 RepID=A0A7W0CUZ4_9ACTN|nr:non-ribosomal peptide synthetase [Nonomuraea soli]MBA2897859.1 amino acid adenylation domain-containing protein [Nonomuraea soli]
MPPRHSPPLLHDLITRQAALTPDAVAIRQWERSLTFGELTERAAALAHRLRELGAGPEVRVGVCGRRTPDLLVAVLGVLMSGGAYVPLDPAHPRKRLSAVIEDAGITTVIADEDGTALLAGSGVRLLPYDHGRSAVPPEIETLPQGSAYTLFTSGSTGRPKGVVVSHASAVAFVTMAGAYFDLDEGCRSIGFAALGFDVSVLDVFAPLARGGSVMFAPDADRADPGRLQRFLEEHRVTWGTIPPALLPLLDPARLPELRDLLTAGEPAGPEQVARWSRPGVRRFHNWYGPTETTVCVVGTALEGRWDRPLPIGLALPGCVARILDERLRPCPPGTAGELCIGGPQLARGYLDRPAMTADRFVPDPEGPPGARLYRTGDLVALDPDGRIAFLGRLDRQVKLRGQRVEMGEVEAVIRAHPGVRHAVADVSEGIGGWQELTAYLAPADAPDVERLREHCLESLPAYMVPSRVVRLDVLPLTVAGKIDMAALRALPAEPAGGGVEQEPPAAGHAEELVAAARTEAEELVATAWAEAFESARPSSTADFFAAGGHSLLAMRLAAALRRAFERDVAVEDVLTGRTVAGMAVRAAAAPPLTARPPGLAEAALSPIQRRMWFVERLAPGTPAHNIAMAQRLSGPLDVAALERALAVVAERHEVLRWRVPQSAGVPTVEVDVPGPVPLPVRECGEAELGEVLDAEARTVFDLGSGPLWRARLLRLAGQEHVLAITAHHIVFDGWSQAVLYDDIARAYRGETAEPLEASFGGYVRWLGERDGADLDWWAGQLAGVPPVLDLPRDRPRPPVQTFEGASVAAFADPGLGTAVRTLAARLGATPYAVMLTAYAHVLGRLAGRDDLVIGTPVADRRDPALAPLAGCLVHVLPLRLRLDGEAAFGAQVTACQERLAGALAHLDVRLERLVEKLGPGRDLSRNPLVQVLFNMYDFAEPRLDLPGVRATPLPPSLPGALFDLTLYVAERDGGYELQAAYNPALFDRERVEALLAGYLRLLGEVVAAPEAAVSSAGLRAGAAGLPESTSPVAGWDGPGLVELVMKRVAERPHAPAIVGESSSLDYAEVAALAAATCRGVHDTLGRREGVVAVLAARTPELPALLLGVLASGARWAILDAALPPARLAAQAAAAGAGALVACPGTMAPQELAHLPVVHPQVAEAAVGLEPAPASERGYLAFTSGTTGAPKPVAAAEAPLARFVSWYPAHFGLTSEDRFALLAGLAHDPLLRDVFTPLVLGGTLYVPVQERIRDPLLLTGWLREHRITVAHLTPQLGNLVAAAAAPVPDLRLVLFGGDRLSRGDAARMAAAAPGARLVNSYGTTETPQAQALHPLTSADLDAGTGAGETVPAGRGVDGADLLVLTRSGAPAAVGELGEIVVRSPRLSHGYLDAELTRARFGADGLTYRTGDLGRYDAHGRVIPAGRADDQVKIRGHRVELGEIEQALLTHPGVRSAAATVAERAGGQVVHAYAVPASAAVQAEELRRHLRAVLPDHLVPAELVLLPALPLTGNGKVDRARLPAPPRAQAAGRGEQPATATERLVAGVWQEVLGLPRVSTDENFFEIGGHSLATAQVQARLSTSLGREVAIVDLFRHPTVRALAAHLDGEARPAGSARAARRLASRRARPATQRPHQARRENGQ